MLRLPALRRGLHMIPAIGFRDDTMSWSRGKLALSWSCQRSPAECCANSNIDLSSPGIRHIEAVCVFSSVRCVGVVNGRSWRPWGVPRGVSAWAQSVGGGAGRSRPTGPQDNAAGSGSRLHASRWRSVGLLRSRSPPSHLLRGATRLDGVTGCVLVKSPKKCDKAPGEIV
jgi:hypothetical protein